MERKAVEANLFAKKWDKIKAGYVPIHITSRERVISSDNYYFPEGIYKTVAGALKSLNYPDVLIDWPSANLTVPDIRRCSKLSFLMKTLERIGQQQCNLDLAIVASTNEVEDLLVSTFNLFQFQFKPISQIIENSAPVYGVLVRFRKNRDLPPNFKLSVDFIITYDAANAPHRKFADYFKGVYYDKPGIVNLVCYRTADARICNYRDSYSNMSFNGTTNLKNARFEIAACFYNVSYPTLKPGDIQALNDNILARFVSWLLRKEDTTFGPIEESTVLKVPRPAATGGGTPAAAGEKRRASSIDATGSSRRAKKTMNLGSLRSLGYDNSTPPQKMNLLRARIQTSFPHRELKLPSLLLHPEVIHCIYWLSNQKIVSSRRPKSGENFNLQSGKTDNANSTNTSSNSSTISGKNNSQTANISIQNQGSSTRSGTPSIHPSRLAMIEASQPPSPQSSSPSQNTQLPENEITKVSNIDDQNINNDIPVIVQSNNTPAQANPNEDTDVDMTAQSSVQGDTQMNTEDDNNSNEKNDVHEESDKAHEDSPEESLSRDLNDFEVALERAHLELMRSLLGKEDDG